MHEAWSIQKKMQVYVNVIVKSIPIAKYNFRSEMMITEE